MILSTSVSMAHLCTRVPLCFVAVLGSPVITVPSACTSAAPTRCCCGVYSSLCSPQISFPPEWCCGPLALPLITPRARISVEGLNNRGTYLASLAACVRHEQLGTWGYCGRVLSASAHANSTRPRPHTTYPQGKSRALSVLSLLILPIVQWFCAVRCTVWEGHEWKQGEVGLVVSERMYDELPHAGRAQAA